MNVDRRLMRFPVPLELVVPFLRGECPGIARELPEDAKPLGGAYWSPEYGALMFTIHSLTFEPVPRSGMIPIGNSPYLLEPVP